MISKADKKEEFRKLMINAVALDHAVVGIYLREKTGISKEVMIQSSVLLIFLKSLAEELDVGLT